MHIMYVHVLFYVVIEFSIALNCLAILDTSFTKVLRQQINIRTCTAVYLTIHVLCLLCQCM